MMKTNWWKILAVMLLVYVCIYGFFVPIPDIAKNSILQETIRNVFFHVPMWFAMITLLIVSAVYAVRHLRSGKAIDDEISFEAVKIAMLFGMLGLLTGMIWARMTWTSYWTNDPKLNGVGIGLLMYSAYYVLRNGIEDPHKRARIASVYNIFAFPIFMVLIWILPRINDDLHPGNGNNPAFGQYDLDNHLRMVFYPACIGWILLGVWFLSLNIKLRKMEMKIEEKDI